MVKAARDLPNEGHSRHFLAVAVRGLKGIDGKSKHKITGVRAKLCTLKWTAGGQKRVLA